MTRSQRQHQRHHADHYPYCSQHTSENQADYT